MSRWTSKPFVIALLLLLAASLAANLLLYRKANRPLFEEGDRPLIERTVGLFTRGGANHAAIEAETFPLVMRLSDRTCVELRRHDGRGYQRACYDGRNRPIEQSEGIVG
jgi:hypothetical protein